MRKRWQPVGALFRGWETAVADENGYSDVGRTGGVAAHGMHALIRSIGILGTCLKEAPEFGSSSRRQVG
jgi:hypothetical protein